MLSQSQEHIFVTLWSILEMSLPENYTGTGKLSKQS